MTAHKVGLVVDRDFGDRLLDIAKVFHVWICDTPANREAAEKAWAAVPPGAVWNEVGATTFRVGENDSPEEMAAGRLVDLDEHHPGWSRIEFFGVGPEAGLRAALQEYGADEFRETQEGFICSRPSTEATPVYSTADADDATLRAIY